MKNFLTALLVLVAFSLTTKAQTTKYQGLKSKGQIPEEFTKLTTQKIEDAKNQDTDGLERVNNKTKNKFYEMSNFGIDELLQSGQVCFNDTISSYVSDVLEEIKSANHNIPMDVRIYTIKSPIVNAFTTDQGIIFINTGLLAQLENEAQLAFVLCHELVHYMEKHVREGFVEDVAIASGKNDYKKSRNVDKQLASAKFSRKLETEADELGLEMFLNTDYNANEVDGVFDVLLYSYLPFDEIPFDSSILEVGGFQIPDKFFLKELNAIEVDEDEDDSDHTHPNIRKRRSSIDRQLMDVSKTGKNFLVSETDFYAVRAAARYEVLRLQLIEGNYSEALYSASILQKDFPDNPLPKIAIGEILFGTSVFASTNDRKQVTGYYKKKQGNVQQVYYLLSKLKKEDLAILATRYNYYLHEEYPEDKFIEERLDILFRDLAYYYDLNISDIKFEARVVDTSTVEATSEVEKPKTGSKYDKIKNTKPTSKVKTSEDKYWARETMFVNCDCEQDLELRFEKGIADSDKLKYQNAETGDPVQDEKSIKERQAYQKQKKKKGRSLGIDKIVLVDPYYAVINTTSRKSNYKLIKSEEEKIEQIDEFSIVAEAANLNVDVFTSSNFTSNDVDKFNDYSLLNEWISERYKMENRSGVVSSSEEVAHLVERYGTKYFAWTSVVNLTYPRSYKFSVMLLSIYSIVGIPYGIYYVATPKKATVINFALFNIETGNLVMYEERELPMADSDGLLRSHYFDMFNQIKK